MINLETSSLLNNLSHSGGPDIAIAQDMSFLCGWEIKGLDTEGISDDQIENRLADIGSAMQGLYDGEALWLTLERRQIQVPPAHKTTNPLVSIALEPAGSGSDYFYENRIFIVLQSPTDADLSTDDRFAIFNGRRTEARLALGRAFKLRDLVGYGEGLKSSEFFDLLARMAQGGPGDVQPGREFPKIDADDWIMPTFVHDKKNILPEIREKTVAIFGVRGFLGSSINTRALRDLESLPLTYRWTSRLVIVGKEKLGAIVNKVGAGVRQSGGNFLKTIITGDVGERSLESHIAENELSLVTLSASRGGETYVAFESAFFVDVEVIENGDFLEDSSSERLAIEPFTILNNATRAAGLEIMLEREMAAAVYCHAQPGTRDAPARIKWLSARAALCASPIQSIWHGSDICPSKLLQDASEITAPALMRTRAMTGEEFNFNLHAGDRGHTLIVGPSGGGKSVLLSAIAASWMKYDDAQIIFFDKHRSSFHTCLSLGGRVYDFGNESNDGIAPLSEHEELGFTWTMNWLKQIVEKNGCEFTPNIRSELEEAIKNSNDDVKLSMSSLANFALPEDIKQIFDNLVGDNQLDAPNAKLDWAPFTVFEGYGLFESGDLKATLILDYLFEKVERRLADGRPTLIIVDEAASYLSEDQFADRIGSWFAEIGKFNAAVVLATQSWKTYTDSKCAKSLTTNSMTKIFLQNPDAKTPEAYQDYQSAGLSEQQTNLVRAMTPKQHYLVCQKDREGAGDDSGYTRVMDLGLTDLFLDLVTRTNPHDSVGAVQSSERDPLFFTTNLINSRVSGGL